MRNVEFLTTLLFTNSWTFVVKLMQNRTGDDELEGISQTYERPANAPRWSNPYRKLNQLTIATHAVSLISTVVLFFAEEYCVHVINTILFLLSWLFLLDLPVRLFLMIRAHRRAKIWAMITNNKKRLTRKERREAEEELKRLLHHPLQWQKQVRLYQKKRMEETKELKRLMYHPFQWRKMLDFYKRK